MAAWEILHGLHGADAAALAGEGAGGFEGELVGILDGLGVGARDVALEGGQAVLLVELHIGVGQVHEGADLVDGFSACPCPVASRLEAAGN